MLDRFSFQYHALENMLIHLDQFLQGTMMCDVIIFDDKSKKYKMKSRVNLVANPVIEDINIEQRTTEISTLTGRNPGYYWLFGNELAWRLNNHENLNFDLFTNPAGLLIILAGKGKSGQNDAMIFYFPSDLRNFRLADSRLGTGITEGERKTIGKLIYSSIKGLEIIGLSDLTNWEELMEHYKEHELEILRLRAENEKNKIAFSKSIVKHCNRVLAKISEEMGLEISFSEELIDEMKKLREVPVFIEDDIRKAIKINNLKEKQTKRKPLIINITDLKITMETDDEPTIEDKTIELQMRAPYSFLERVETAMQILDLQRKPFTGENVGAHMNPTVTKSALSQYARTWQDSLKQLLLLHPEKWTLTRNYLKTIKNLLDNQALGKMSKEKMTTDS
jgi:hypothetical protein